MRQPEQHQGSVDRLNTVAESAHLLGTSAAFLYGEIAARRMSVVRIRGQVRIDASSFAEYLERSH